MHASGGRETRTTPVIDPRDPGIYSAVDDGPAAVAVWLAAHSHAREGVPA